MAYTRTLASASDALTDWEKENRDVAYAAAVEGIVLLENKGILPLTPGPVALFGAGGSRTVKGGTGSGEVNDRHAVTIEEGLESAGFTVTTKSWLRAYDARYRQAEEAYAAAFRKKLYRLNITELINIMRDPFSAPVGQDIAPSDIRDAATDTCIYVVARQAGEGSDRRLDHFDCSLTPQEREQIALCAASFANMILVINVGGVFDLGFLEEIDNIGAVVFYAQQGSMGGLALGHLLSGKQTFSGKLADTWAMTYSDYPCAMEYSYLNGELKEEYYREGIYVGYRYFDTFGIRPRYPFGYGLSYTDFSLETVSITEKDSEITVQVRVINTGDTFSGKETVQLYASCPQTPSLPKEHQRLVAFEKSGLLDPGESQVLKLRLSPEDLASFREADCTTVLEQGPYILHLGNSSRATRPTAVLRLEKEWILSRHQSLCAPTKPVCEITPPACTPVDTEGLPVLTLPPGPTVVYDYAPAPEPPAAGLSVKEQLMLVTGGGMFAWRAFDAPGAAGATTSRLQKKGIPNVVLADGPAGVRLQKLSVRLKNGAIKPVRPAMAVMDYLPGFVKKFLLGDPKKGELLYQFTTAFPVGLALAQTWNRALARQIGQAVGREMRAYGVSFWLAPALNIHRNILCGRNYEYYSEDPFISGCFAAAMTEGVQQVPGCFVTLKHFACNNQEENRNRTNANVSQRALREIYLRGFEIAVRRSAPGSIMSSYNRLNGTYTPNSHDLLTMILRREWGFDGIVMTDWLSTGGGLARDDLAIRAGNDLIMPGSGSVRRRLRRGLRRGTFRTADLHRCSANVLKAIRACSVENQGILL